MKKVLFTLSIIFFSIILGFFILLKYKVSDIKKENMALEKEFEKLNTNYNTVKEENSLYEEKLDNIRKENEEILKEKEIWEETKQNLENSLS